MKKGIMDAHEIREKYSRTTLQTTVVLLCVINVIYFIAAIFCIQNKINPFSYDEIFYLVLVICAAIFPTLLFPYLRFTKLTGTLFFGYSYAMIAQLMIFAILVNIFPLSASSNYSTTFSFIIGSNFLVGFIILFYLKYKKPKEDIKTDVKDKEKNQSNLEEVEKVTGE